MRFFHSMITGLFTAGLVLAQAPPVQEAPPAKEAPPAESPAAEFKGTPPRTGPADYQSQAKAGMFSIGADFDGHGVPTPEQTLSDEDYVVVEVGFFGPPNSKLTLAREDFSLNVTGTGKKAKTVTLPAEPYERAFQSLKDPEWVPPEQPSESKSKGGLTTGGGGGNDQPPPLPPKMPFNLVRAMQLHVQSAVLPTGERPLPQAGLLFFRYHSKTDKISSLELIYEGPAGKATLPLQP